MKKILCLFFSLALLAVSPAFGQGRGDGPPLTTFNLDFPGGTPGELVAAITKAMGKPLNAIVTNDHAQVKLPPMKMNGVTAGQLFAALSNASPTRVSLGNSWQNVRFGFRTEGPVTDTSVWYFFFDGGVPEASKQSKLYHLTPYLEARNLSVDDITTAIQTNWRMSGISPASLSFHKETNLLIAVGDRPQLAGIDAVLAALKPDTPPATGTSPAQPTPQAPAAAPAAPATSARGGTAGRAGGRG